jgi:hypothetical protein
LVWRSAVRLLDYSDPKTGRKIRDKLDAICSELSIQYHGVRFRTTGYGQIIEGHLLFPRHIGQRSPPPRNHSGRNLAGRIGDARQSHDALGISEDRADVHREEHYTGKPE